MANKGKMPAMGAGMKAQAGTFKNLRAAGKQLGSLTQAMPKQMSPSMGKKARKSRTPMGSF